jgi:DNA-binding NarL/FixJ family response regulator
MPLMNGTDTILAIRKDFPDARIIVLTTYSVDARQPAHSEPPLTDICLRACSGRSWSRRFGVCLPVEREQPPEVAVEIAGHHMDDSLSEREIEVLREVAAVNSNKMIAR